MSFDEILSSRQTSIVKCQLRAVIIHNPSAGTNDHKSSLDAAIESLRALGWQVISRETQASGDATQFARAAADQGFDAAFAVGGDGTLNEVLNGLLESDTAVGVLPLGTANVWALEMGLPLNDMARAATLQAEARTRQIDVGVVKGKGFGPRAFILSCGAGFDAMVVHEVEAQRELKRRWGKLLFIGIGIRRAIEYRGRRVSVTVDGETRRRRVILALTSNTQLYGAMVRMPPDARVDDGLLDVTLLHGDNALHMLWHFIRLGTGFYHMQPDIEHMRGREVEIRGRALPIHVDAEPLGKTPIQIHIKSRALRVLVPETANLSLFTKADDPSLTMVETKAEVKHGESETQSPRSTL